MHSLDVKTNYNELKNDYLLNNPSLILLITDEDKLLSIIKDSDDSIESKFINQKLIFSEKILELTQISILDLKNITTDDINNDKILKILLYKNE
jgi:hypothetical protein